MIAYVEGGAMNGKATEVPKKLNSLFCKLPDGKTEWYRKTGKKVYLASGKKKDEKQDKDKDDRIKARVFRYSNTVDPENPYKQSKKKSKKKSKTVLT